MNESLTIVLPRKMSLSGRISEASRQINEWLLSPDVVFKNERDKLQMTKWERDDREYRYHYLIIRGKGLSASTLSTPLSEPELETAEVPVNRLRIVGSVRDLHSEL
jgi:hypothetical protein